MRLKTTLILPLLLLACLNAMPQGLSFTSTANSIEKRTSYDVFCDKKPTFRHRLDISFQMRLPLQENVGYIIRITDKQHNQAYNMFYDGRGNDYFALNEEGNKILILQHFDRKKLRAKEWFAMRITFDMDRKDITLSVDGQTRTIRQPGLPAALSPDIIFGRSDYLIDVPTFSMRDLEIKDSERAYLFPLRQVSGNDVYDADGKKTGHVDDPYWLMKDHYHWQRLFSSNSKTPAGYNFDERSHNVLYYNRHKLQKHDIISGKSTSTQFASPCPVRLYLGTSFIYPDSNRLYTYEVFREGKRDDEPSVASLDLNTCQWRTEATTQVNEGQMHHHGAWLDPQHGEFTIFGGFANMRYHSTFYTYSVAGHKWNWRHDISGKRFPRYFLSLGYDGSRYAYMFGGMGNESGDQTVGRVFYYDLHRLDTRTKKVVKLWDTNMGKDERLVFSKSMVIDGGYFYTLGYSEYLSDSHLKLYRFSIKDGSWQQLGDSIPIHPDRIESEVNLYYDRLLRKFVATVLEYKTEAASTFKAYALSAPALTETALAEASEIPSGNHLWLLVGLVAAASATLIVTLEARGRRKRKSETLSVGETSQQTASYKSNSISLFGEFQVVDDKGRDITYMFTGKQKTILCLLLQYAPQGGIASRYLGNLVWGEKAADKIKNSRSVAINHLRKALSGIDGVSLAYGSGKYRMEWREPFHCDYLRLMEIMADGDDTLQEKAEMTGILKRGKFLLGDDTPLLDPMKADLESKLLPMLKISLRKAVEAGSADVMACVQAIFNIDPTDQDAYEAQIKYLKKTGQTLAALEAQIRYKEASAPDK